MAKPKNNQPKNYIFDFDGTIADSLPAFIAVFNKLARGNENPLTPEEIEHFRGLSSRRAIRQAGVRWWQIPRIIIEGSGDFHALAGTLQPFDGITEVIKTLYLRGDRLFIVTSNSRDSVDMFLINHNLDGFFVDIATNASIFGKARYIRGLMKRNKIKRKDSIYIGDETRDVRAARLARIKIASVTWGFNNEKILKKQRPTYLLDKPSQIPHLFDKEK